MISTSSARFHTGGQPLLFGTLLFHVLPPVEPGLVVTGIYNLLGAWNHFFFGRILTSFEARTLPVEASNFVGEYAL